MSEDDLLNAVSAENISAQGIVQGVVSVPAAVEGQESTVVQHTPSGSDVTQVSSACRVGLHSPSKPSYLSATLLNVNRNRSIGLHCNPF